MSPYETVRRIFPNATDMECSSLLWNNTGFPHFWKTGNPVRDVLHSLRTLKHSIGHGWAICDHCNGKATLPEHQPMECRACRGMLRRASRRIRREEKQP